MNYTQKLIKVREFSALKINPRLKNYTPQQKRLITTYYNKLKYMGYFDAEVAGYQTVSIKSKNAPKIKGSPKINKMIVEVGTIVKDGKIITNPKRKVKFKKGKIYVTQDGAPRIWRFKYDIARNWSEKEFVAHIKKQIGKDGLKRTQYFAIGAGTKYQVGDGKDNKDASPYNDSLVNVARDILKIGNRYTPNFTEEYQDRGQTKKLENWLQEIVVYEYIDDIESRIKNRKLKKKKRKSKRKKK